MLQAYKSFVSQDIHQIIKHIFNNKVRNLTERRLNLQMQLIDTIWLKTY